MRRLIAVLSFLAMALSLTASPRALAFDVTAVAGLNTATGLPAGASTSPAFSYGALVGFGLIPAVLGVETGLLIVPVKTTFDASATPGGGSFTTNYTNVPLLARFKSFPYLTPGIGVSYSLASVGNETYDWFNTTLSLKYGSSIAPLVEWVVDARYLMKMGDYGFNTLQAFTGFQFGF